MRSSLFLGFFLMAIYSLFFNFSLFVASGECLSKQQTLLLQLKNNLMFNSDSSVKLVMWNQNVDCCSWRGITCSDGHVIGLDLANESISGGLDNSSSLFGLSYIQSLNLAYNNFYGDGIPSNLGKLTNLRYLNLSCAYFGGRIPLAISRLTRLVVLDLSFNYDLKLKNLSLNMLIQNISELTKLYMDGIAISSQDNKWCQALSSLLNLKVLSLSSCGLSGPINSSLRNLQFLSVIHLGSNNFSSIVPEFFVYLKNLTSLDLSSCNLNGKFPQKIFQVSTLQELDLSNNALLQGSLPKFLPNESLRTLKLGYTNFSGTLPRSIGNLKMLLTMNLQECNFIGSIPTSVTRLTKLVHLDMSRNALNGSIPIFSITKNLIEIQLDGNNLSSQITTTQWENFLNLEVLSLSLNSLDGNIPISLFSLPSLQELSLSNNRFSSQINEFFNGSSSLKRLDLSSNNLDGPIPISIFELQGLKWLSLSSNNFSGTLQLGVTASRNLLYLDLSKNQIEGEIPNWIKDLPFLEYLNLSHNSLETIAGFSTNCSLKIIDLHSNQLRGQLPSFPFVQYLAIQRNISFTHFVSFSSNMLYGTIPESICDALDLQVLDLSNNSLSGTIPQCLIELSSTLKVLNLGSNKLNGMMSNMFPDDCQLQTLTLNGNQLQGKLPKSLANCSMMEVLDIGNNNFKDTFPFHLKHISTMRVLILRTNKFYGLIPHLGHDANWSMLHILDIASNNFIGSLPTITFSTMRAMIDEDKPKSQLDYLQYNNSGDPSYAYITSITPTPPTSYKYPTLEVKHRQQMFPSYHYQYVVTLTIKGSIMKLEKILIVFTTIDLSCNNFDGPIPEEIGELKLLYALNLSHNSFWGSIPPSLGKLTYLESLDLSSNNLTGKIPVQLADGLIFLSVVNLSFNQLEGQIPKSKQFATFENSSFEGNKALCGFPFSSKCIDEEPQLLPPTPGETHLNSKTTIEWNYISPELGFVFGLGIVILPVMFWKKWRVGYYQSVDNTLFRIFPQLYLRENYRRKGANNNKRQRH